MLNKDNRELLLNNSQGKQPDFFNKIAEFINHYFDMPRHLIALHCLKFKKLYPNKENPYYKYIDEISKMKITSQDDFIALKKRIKEIEHSNPVGRSPIGLYILLPSDDLKDMHSIFKKINKILDYLSSAFEKPQSLEFMLHRFLKYQIVLFKLPMQLYKDKFDKAYLLRNQDIKNTLLAINQKLRECKEITKMKYHPDTLSQLLTSMIEFYKSINNSEDNTENSSPSHLKTCSDWYERMMYQEVKRYSTFFQQLRTSAGEDTFDSLLNKEILQSKIDKYMPLPKP